MPEPRVRAGEAARDVDLEPDAANEPPYPPLLSLRSRPSHWVVRSFTLILSSLSVSRRLPASSTAWSSSRCLLRNILFLDASTLASSVSFCWSWRERSSRSRRTTRNSLFTALSSAWRWSTCSPDAEDANAPSVDPRTADSSTAPTPPAVADFSALDRSRLSCLTFCRSCSFSSRSLAFSAPISLESPLPTPAVAANRAFSRLSLATVALRDSTLG